MSSSSTSVITADYIQSRLESEVPMLAPEIIALGPKQIELQLQRLSPELATYYWDAYCFYCGKCLEESEEYDNHFCAAKQTVKSYYQQYNE